MENYLSQHSQDTFLFAQQGLDFSIFPFPGLIPPAQVKHPRKKSRGRKKLRPGNPLKTEVMDKHWLRLFRSFVKKHFMSLKSLSSDKDFWTWFIYSGKPGKNSMFPSYNSEYKHKLFNSCTFCSLFTAWGLGNGFVLNSRKGRNESWKFYAQYFFGELLPKTSNLALSSEFWIFYEFVCKQVVSFPQMTQIYEEKEFEDKKF